MPNQGRKKSTRKERAEALKSSHIHQTLDKRADKRIMEVPLITGSTMEVFLHDDDSFRNGRRGIFGDCVRVCVVSHSVKTAGKQRLIKPSLFCAAPHIEDCTAS